MTLKETNVCHRAFLYQYIKSFVYSLRLQRCRNTAPLSLAPISATVMLEKYDYRPGYMIWKNPNVQKLRKGNLSMTNDHIKTATDIYVYVRIITFVHKINTQPIDVP